MAEKAHCYITTSNKGSGAYAVRADTDENVYIPFSIAEAIELEEFEEVEAIVVANDRDDPPWRAIKVRRMGD